MAGLHQAKGLEFPLVFIPDLGTCFNLGEREALYADRVPLHMLIDDDRIAWEERVGRPLPGLSSIFISSMVVWR